MDLANTESNNPLSSNKTHTESKDESSLENNYENPSCSDDYDDNYDEDYDEDYSLEYEPASVVSTSNSKVSLSQITIYRCMDLPE